MSWSHTIAAFDLLDDPHASGQRVREHFLDHGAADTEIHVETVEGHRGSTDFVHLSIPGRSGASTGGDAPTLGILGRLGGLGARPEQIGFVSDGEGALTAVATGAKLLDMRRKGDLLEGDVIIGTHIDPDAPTQPHDPVPFMGSVLNQDISNAHEVHESMDAILSIDTTRGNRICNHNGIAITPTVADGWILRISESLLDIVSRTTGEFPTVLPLTTQDITPYSNGVFHVNSILQPSTATSAPVVGVAIVSETPVAGSATGATGLRSTEQAVRFTIETAKDYGRGVAAFLDAEEFTTLKSLYGSLSHLRTPGTGSS